MIDHLDHLVLTTAKEVECVDFYTRVLGMRLESFIGGTPPVERKALSSATKRSTFISKAGSLSPRQIFQPRGHSIFALLLIAHLKR